MRNKVLAVLLWALVCVIGLWLFWPLMFNPVKVTIHISAEKEETFQIFYDVGNGLNGKDMISEPYKPKEGFSRLDFTLPRAEVGMLRLDPGSRSGYFNIRLIRIEAGGITRIYSAKDIPEHFIFENLQPGDMVSEENLHLTTTGNRDAQIILQHPVNAVFPLVNHRLKTAIPVSFGVLFLAGLLLIIIAGSRLFTGIKHEFREAKAFYVQYLSPEKIHAYFHGNRHVFIWTFMLAVIAYGYELFNFSLSPDEELNSFIKAADATVYPEVGRWGIYFLRQLLSADSVLPYFPFLIAILCLAASAAVFITQFRMNLYAKLIFAIVFVTHPIHTYYLGFNTSNMYYTIGMLLTVLAFLAYSELVSGKRPVILLGLISVVLLMFGLSMYQSHLAFFIVLGLFFLFYHEYQSKAFTPKTIAVKILYLISIGIVAVVIYQVINLATKYIVLGSIHSNSGGYLDKMYAWDKKSISEILKSLYSGILNYFTAKHYYGGISGYTVVGIVPVIIYYILKRNAPAGQKLMVLLLLVLLFFAPFTIVVLNGMPLPVRTLMAFPLMLGLIWAFGYDYSPRWLRTMMLVFAIYLLLNNTYTNTRLFYASRVSWEADRNMAVRITERVYDLDLPTGEEATSVVFAGSYDHQANVLFLKSDIHGASFFAWDNGASYRIRAFFRMLGINDFDIIDYSRAQHLSGEISRMPNWPERESVKLIGDIVVVKLSETQAEEK